MTTNRTVISTGDLTVEEKATYAQASDLDKLTKRQDNNEETMRAVIIILLVMVGAMIFSLQIANNDKINTVNINVDGKTIEALKSIK